MKKRSIFLLLSFVLVMCFFCSPLSAATRDVDWSGTFMATGNNNSTKVDLPTDSNMVEEVWNAFVGNNTIVIVDDYIYTYNGITGGSAPNGIYKIDKNSGEIVSKLDCPIATGYYYSYMIYANNMIYVSIPGYVMAIDPDSFSIQWTSSVPAKDYAAIQYANGCLVTNGTVLNAETGALVKTLSGSYIWASGAVVGSYYYVPGYDGKVRSFHTSTWEEVDSLTFEGNGAALMYNAGKIYWAVNGAIYSVSVSSGVFNDSTLTTYAVPGYRFLTPPVCSGSRVYFAGYTVINENGTGYGAIFVFDKSMNHCYTVQTSDSVHKFQSAPILKMASSGGGAVSGLDNAVLQSGSETYLYVQSYAAPGCIYMLVDSESSTSGELVKLATPSVSNYVFSQLAYDKDGAIYYSNDSGNLFKIQTAQASAPEIISDLSSNEVIYEQGAVANALTVEAKLNGNGTLSYQWQSHSGDGNWADIRNANTNSYTPSTLAAGTVFYRCVVKSSLYDDSVTTNSKVAKITVNAVETKEINVTFRLVGASLAEGRIDYGTSPNESFGSEYINWYKTKSYTVTEGTSAYELFVKAMNDAGLQYDASSSYVKTITAPAVCGGFALSEKTNGKFSGWMYVINGKYPSEDIGSRILADGDAMIVHYINDYRYEQSSLIWLPVADDDAKIAIGDMNMDGKVNLMDVTLLRRYVAGWKGDYILTGADVNASGVVDLMDVTILRRYVAGWNVTLGK